MCPRMTETLLERKLGTSWRKRCLCLQLEWKGRAELSVPTKMSTEAKPRSGRQPFSCTHVGGQGLPGDSGSDYTSSLFNSFFRCPVFSPTST